MEGLRNTLRQSLSMLAYLTVPATVGLMVLGVPVVRLLYERGRFTPADTQATAAALFLYSFGLVGYTGVKVLAPAFYALGTPRVPLLGQRPRGGDEPRRDLRLRHRGLGFRAIALGTALGSLVNAGLLVALFERRVGGLFGHGPLPARRPDGPRGRRRWAPWPGSRRRASSGSSGRAASRAQLVTGLVPVAAGILRLRPADPRAAGGGGRGPLAHGPRAAGARRRDLRPGPDAPGSTTCASSAGLAENTLIAYERDLRELVGLRRGPGRAAPRPRPGRPRRVLRLAARAGPRAALPGPPRLLGAGLLPLRAARGPRRARPDGEPAPAEGLPAPCRAT